MKRILLTQGKYAIVDDGDYGWLSQYKWCACYMKGLWYAIRSENGKYIRMHRQIMNCPANKEIDHLDGQSLDNRKSNMRICTHQENCLNRKANRNSVSKYKGVTWFKGKWVSIIRDHTKFLYLGRFVSEINAAKAFDTMAIKLGRTRRARNFS